MTEPADRITLNRGKLAALLAHHADALAARWRTADGPGSWVAVSTLDSHAAELTADEETPAVRELLDSILSFNAEQQPVVVPSVPADTERRDRYAAALFNRFKQPLRWAEATEDTRAAVRKEADVVLVVADAEQTTLHTHIAEGVRLLAGEHPANAARVQDRHHIADRIAEPEQQTVAVQPSVDRADLRDRIDQAVSAVPLCLGPAAADRARYGDPLIISPDEAAALAAAVLAVLPTLTDQAAEGIDWKAKYEAECDTSRRLLTQRQELAEERYAWQERGDRAEAEVKQLRTDQAAVLREAADEIDRETQRLKDAGVLEPDKFRPCRDATAELRRMADEAQQAGDSAHCCRNCDGIDPGTCLTNPNRTAEHSSGPS
ncbi:hypothetical protein AB0I46_31850 [Streptomyces spectabilis]